VENLVLSAFSDEISAIDENLKRFFGFKPLVKGHGIVYSLSNRAGERAFYKAVDGNKAESENVTFDDRFDVQWYFRLEGINSFETVSYGRKRNWLNNFLFSLVISAKHDFVNQETLYISGAYAIHHGGGVLLGANTDMFALHQNEFIKDAFHIETQMILINFEIRKVLNFNCLDNCYFDYGIPKKHNIR